ncbi:Nif3-like dinuclear metal center hexameric protein [Gracilinema caldarium]|uniref:NGG1p interacting factor 3 protein, NIF3 n=1 Tax=Gracilinema caldarium (strain ATCC 51460 / DSM 7334 / H1) TaxID=744872 RepID=F8EWN0_GRAC1|nr:Nif3-like dinuclear metal center hexameric protein [Gracilinema caldarium]AEJ18193.1 NGG1p interacting factor 3 protein, NIF3 [Gracilinema caldarium DSM 7334]
MTTKQLDSYFRSFLDIDGFLRTDDSLNGLQVDNDGRNITKVAFAVDACFESITLAAQRGVGMLFVHHGLFWGKPAPITGIMRERLQVLLSHNIALYAVHLPLDQHPVVGNNAGLADLLGLEQREPFGDYHQHKIGYKGILPKPISIDEAVKRISFMGRPPLGVYPFGTKEIRSVAIVSGGAAMEAFQAIDEQVDLYITGEMSHSVYHYAVEGALNMIAGGHYSTEVWGVRRVMEKLANEYNLEVEFLDIPTGL